MSHYDDGCYSSFKSKLFKISNKLYSPSILERSMLLFALFVIHLPKRRGKRRSRRKKKELKGRNNKERPWIDISVSKWMYKYLLTCGKSKKRKKAAKHLYTPVIFWLFALFFFCGPEARKNNKREDIFLY